MQQSMKHYIEVQVTTVLRDAIEKKNMNLVSNETSLTFVVSLEWNGSSL